MVLEICDWLEINMAIIGIYVIFLGGVYPNRATEWREHYVATEGR